ncbi:hypothetical protein CARUB_v10003373mg [Capsella rubella]|uniref:Uncharacterized protein n=1 Tax=Capsella rubella TaxID=81985 RepID=R0HCA8_9BRAS|nr:hypothetical protein CARUB_v10003373mg [Capsella rubella]
MLYVFGAIYEFYHSHLLLSPQDRLSLPFNQKPNTCYMMETKFPKRKKKRNIPSTMLFSIKKEYTRIHNYVGQVIIYTRILNTNIEQR